MGFSHVGAFLVLSAATLFFTSHAMQGGLDAQQETARAWRVAEARDAALRTSDVEVQAVSWDNATRGLTLDAWNAGAAVHDGGLVEVVVDGAVRTANVTARTVDGAASDVWAPLSTLRLVLDLSAWYGPGSSGPTDVVLVTEVGSKAYWRS